MRGQPSIQRSFDPLPHVRAPSARQCHNRDMPIDVEKLALLREIANALAERPLSEVNMLLHEIGLSDIEQSAWDDERWEITPADRSETVLATVRGLKRTQVDDLANAVRNLFEVAVEVVEQPEPDPLVLFASHLATQRAIVGAVGNELTEWGITLFVAHDSIEPDLEWQAEIERYLDECHGGVIFLMPGFKESPWCDQEVGWLLGRHVPCYALKFQGQDPYGPLGKKQALTIPDGKTAPHLALDIVRWARGKPELAPQINGSLVEALKTSVNFRRTDTVWELLHAAQDLTSRQVAGLLTAIRDNGQVYNASGGVGNERGRYPELVFKLALRQPGFASNEEFAREVAEMRGLEALLPSQAEKGSAGKHDPWASIEP